MRELHYPRGTGCWIWTLRSSKDLLVREGLFGQREVRQPGTLKEPPVVHMAGCGDKVNVARGKALE